MNISYNWLRDLCQTQLAPRELAARMTMIGLAVDAVHEAGDDFVLEFDLTSNRPDCLSHLGMAREASTLERGRVSLPPMQVAASDGRAGDFATVEIADADLCPRYTARVIRGVRVAPSPAWLAARLQAIGQRPINNVADITNYVLHELGQPLHAFDLTTLRERRIVVRRARAGEKIKTLDGVERELDAEMLVIADAARPVAIAGVMGGEETEVSDATRDVLIESAFFAPASVRRTSQALGLSTEASYRFERGVDPEGALRAQERAASLICELAGGTATVDAIDVYPEKFEPPVVGLRFARVKALSSLDVSPQDCVRILTALGFALRELKASDGSVTEVRGASDATERSDAAAASDASADASGASAEVSGAVAASFVAPSWRFDIEREADLVEEVARHVGYDKIQDELPPSSSAGEYRAGDERRRAARRVLAAQGFDEAINFSFIDAAHDGKFELLPGLLGDGANAPAAVETDDASGRLVTLNNPIVENATRMRPTLLPGLLDAVRHNFNHGTRNLQLFEIGRVFIGSAEAGKLPLERTSFALVSTGGRLEEGRAGAVRELDFYDLKGAVELAADALKIAPLAFSATNARHLREGQSAAVLLEGQRVGTIGRLSEEIAAAYRFRQPVFVAELDFSALLAAPETPARYQPLARYPSVQRDISLLADRRVTFAELKRTVLELGEEFCRGVELVDVFEGSNVPEGQRSVTLRLEYRADDRTLRDEDVEEAHARVLAALEKGWGARLRA